MRGLNLGLQLAIDDFVAGYSALAWLKKFPVEVVKIDRSFVRDISENGEYIATTGAILKMTRELGLTSIAKAVETTLELAFLRANQNDSVQGYLFSPALPTEQFAALLESGARLDTP